MTVENVDGLLDKVKVAIKALSEKVMSLKKENEVLEKALGLACKELHHATDSCPSNDEWPMQYGHTKEYCEMGCDNNSDGGCYIEYFMKKAEAENDFENE